MARGRKTSKYWRTKMFLMRIAKAQNFPTKKQQNKLTSEGLGEPSRPVVLRRNWNMEELKRHICTLYPRVPLLSSIGFTMFKCKKNNGELVRLRMETMRNVADLESQVKRGRIVLVPNRDRLNDVPRPARHGSPQPSTSAAPVQPPSTPQPTTSTAGVQTTPTLAPPLSGPSTCVVCKGAPVDYVLVDCTHYILCSVCVQHFRVRRPGDPDSPSTRCPLCRAPIRTAPFSPLSV